LLFSVNAILVALKTPSYWEMRGYMGSTFIRRRLFGEVLEFSFRSFVEAISVSIPPLYSKSIIDCCSILCHTIGLLC
jgi:hypothetical protein